MTAIPLSEVKRRRRAALAAMGRCTVCGEGVPAPGAKTCGGCREVDREGYTRRGEAERIRRRKGNNERRNTAVAAGKCRSCLKRKPKPGRKNCPLCIAKNGTRRKRTQILSLVKPTPPPPTSRPAPYNHPWRILDSAGVRKTQWYKAKALEDKGGGPRLVQPSDIQ